MRQKDTKGHMFVAVDACWNLADLLFHPVLQALQGPEMLTPDVLLEVCIEEEIIWGEVWAVSWVGDPGPTKCPDQLQREEGFVRACIVHMHEFSAMYSTSWSPPGVSLVKPLENLAEHNLVDSNWALDKFKVNESLGIKEGWFLRHQDLSWAFGGTPCMR